MQGLLSVNLYLIGIGSVMNISELDLSWSDVDKSRTETAVLLSLIVRDREREQNLFPVTSRRRKCTLYFGKYSIKNLKNYRI